MLTEEQLAQYAEVGYVRIERFSDAATCQAMLDRVIAVARAHAEGDRSAGWLLPEANLAGTAGRPEQLVAKIFRLHRDSVFHEWITAPAVVDIAADLIGSPDVDCFLSQFIFKNPGAWGQPWHQDSHYFAFGPENGGRPIVGLWLAVTDATLENGCLWVVPGSHHEPVHEHVDDRRPGANYGYREIVDFDTSAQVPVLMHAGDLLLFDSHLMHRSTDNVSNGIRAAMVYHCAATGTVDLADHPINDFMTVRSVSNR
ncbi:MAG TPA: phytanoyl-CoA dioxygenase family protein [Acidimicrobiales bacterium]|nr:phytanoyl-CoA dioxygenase family protein [Acidimicrobiales bacterium]